MFDFFFKLKYSKEQGQRCDQRETTDFHTSDESLLYWWKYFEKKPIFFWNYSDFVAEIEIDISDRGNEIIDIYKQNPANIVHYMALNLKKVLESSYYSSLLN